TNPRTPQIRRELPIERRVVREDDLCRLDSPSHRRPDPLRLARFGEHGGRDAVDRERRVLILPLDQAREAHDRLRVLQIEERYSNFDRSVDRWIHPRRFGVKKPCESNAQVSRLGTVFRHASHLLSLKKNSRGGPYRPALRSSTTFATMGSMQQE